MVISVLSRPDRINVVGSSGSGKSTLASRLAVKIDAPYVELDAIHWQPDWAESPDAELLANLKAALAGERWVLDGNYQRTEPIKWKRVQMVVWLDLPFWLVFWQILVRTIRRSITREMLWAGNRESHN